MMIKMLSWGRGVLRPLNLGHGLLGSPQQRTAIPAKSIQAGIRRSAFRTLFSSCPGGGFRTPRFHGRGSGQSLYGMQGNGHGFLAGFRPPEIVFHLDEEVVRRGIRYQFFGVVILRFGAVGGHKCNSSSKSYEHNIKLEVALLGVQMFAQNNSSLAISYSFGRKKRAEWRKQRKT